MKISSRVHNRVAGHHPSLSVQYTVEFFQRLFKAFPYLSIITLSSSWAQSNNPQSFAFIQQAANSRLASLGGVNVSLPDRDVNFFYSNPSLISDTLAGFASASYQFYVADIGQASFSYAHNFNRVGLLAIGVQHINYGTIKSYDPSGLEIGDYNAQETALVISKSHHIGNFRLGGNIKAVFSNLGGFRANAMVLDLGGIFIHPDNDLKIGLTIKNVGIVLSEYSETSNSKLPFDVQAGATFKPEHMPLRFSITAYNFGQSDLTYYAGSSIPQNPRKFDRVLRHFNFATEVLLHRNINLMAAYNYLSHQDLKLQNGGGGAGISLGFSARIKAIEFVFSRSAYIVGTAAYGLTLSADIDKMITKR
jgi:hypothetical protein